MENKLNYFKIVVREATEDLKDGKEAYVFSKEQVIAVKDELKKEVKVKIINGLFCLKI